MKGEKDRVKKILGLFVTFALVLVLAACGPKASELLEEAKEDLKIHYIGDDNASAVTKNVTLVTRGKHDVTITWKSSNTDVIANDGTVTRPSYDEGDKNVTLTATLTLDGKSVKKEFELTVKALEKPISVKLDEAFNALNIGFAVGDNANNVTADLTLPSTAGEATVTWVSTDPHIVSNTGEVVRPFFGENDITVVLTATLTIDDQTMTKTFPVTVKAKDQMTDQDAVEYVKGKISINNDVSSTVIELPDEGSYDVKITWAANKTEYIEITDERLPEEGIYTGGYKVLVTLPRKGEGVVEVVLTATIQKGDATTTKEFTIVLQEAEYLNIESILELTEGNVILEDAVVIGITSDGYYLYDGTGFLFAYTNKVPSDLKIGDKVNVSGSFTLYYDQPEIENPTIFRTVSRDNDLPEATPVTIAEVQSWNTKDRSIYSKPYRIQGTVVIKGQYDNVYLIDENDNEIAIYYKSNQDAVKEFAGQKVILDGIFHAYHTRDKEWRFSFVGTKDDIELAPLSDQEKLAAALENLNLPKQTASDLKLITEINGVTITWTSSDDSVIGTDGKVSRPTAEDVSIKLVAKLTIGELEETKEFSVVVKADIVYSIQDVINNKTKGEIVDVEGYVAGVIEQGYFLFDGTSTIYVFTNSEPTVEEGQQVRITGEYTIFNNQPEIQWITNTVVLTGDDANYVAPQAEFKKIADLKAIVETDKSIYSKFITIVGTVIEVQEGNYTNWYIEDLLGNRVMVYYKSSVDEVAAYKDKVVTLDVFVYRYSNGWQVAYIKGDKLEETTIENQEIIDTAEENLAIETEVTNNLTLPSNLIGVSITWVSNNQAIVINEDGTVEIIRPAAGEEDVVVTLTATLTLGELTKTKEFEVTVKALPQEGEEPVSYKETFDNSQIGTNYVDGSFTGVNGVVWQYVHARDEGNYAIEGSGIMLRRPDEPSSLTGTFKNGIVSFSFEYRKAFTSDSVRNIKVIVTHGGEQREFTLEEFGSGSGEQTTVYKFESGELNLSGEVTVQIRLTGSKGNAQTTIDNFSWIEPIE